MATLKSPRPTPKFFTEVQTFSTKKNRSTPRDQVPPRPPAKTIPPISRFFREKNHVQRAQAVSFRDSENSILSKHYDEDSKELYFDQCFTIEGKIGAGSFGEVFKVKSKEDGRYYAVKRSRERFRGESDRRRKLEEVAKHEQLPKHINCIRFVKAWEEHQHLYIQTELCETSLSNYSELHHDIPETLIWNYLVDLLQALKNLHDHDLIHMDIKPDNIFISSSGICKLGDFGLVLDLKKGDLSEALEGDPKYLAPEIMEGKFTKAADVFSLGITILELACDLDLPQGGKSWHQLRQGQIPMNLLSNVSSDLREVIQLMMLHDYKKRPTVNEIHKFSSIVKVLNRRRRELWMKSALGGIYNVIYIFSIYWQKLWSTMIFQVFHLYKKITRNNVLPSVSSPKPIKRHPSEWDYSVSDDECFEDYSNVSNNSAFPLMDDTSLSSESRYENAFSPNSEGLVNSTPTRNSAKSRINYDPIPILDWDSYRCSPCSSPGNGKTSMSPIRRSSYFVNDDSYYLEPTRPKNLTEVFNALAEKSE